MTDRIHSLTVVLDHDFRDDDLEQITSAIRMIRGVSSIDGHVADYVTHMAEERAKREMRDKLWAVLYPPSKT